jgi:hypothetical protein
MRAGMDARVQHDADERCDFRGAPAGGPEQTPPLGLARAAAAVAQRVAVALRRAGAFAVAVSGPAYGNKIVRRFFAKTRLRRRRMIKDFSGEDVSMGTSYARFGRCLIERCCPFTLRQAQGEG